jgi:hypothetical protein
MNSAESLPPATAITVILTDKETATMDEIALTIRRNTGKSISRSALIRAITTAALVWHRDWLNCRSEGEIRQKVGLRMQTGNR